MTITLADVTVITAIADGASRNRAITEAYGDISQELATHLGTANASWPTFAVWASNTVGRLIRGDLAAAFLPGNEGYTRVLGAVEDEVDDLAREAFDLVLDRETSAGLLATLTSGVGDALAAGNAEVFGEIASVIVRYLDRLRAGAAAADDVDDLATTLTCSRGADPTPLREGVRAYHRALGSPPGSSARAREVLTANYYIGAHEQWHLQRHVSAAMDAPALFVLSGIGWLVDQFVASWSDRIRATWREVCTDILMRFALPEEDLALGEDVPPWQGQDFPQPLATLPQGTPARSLWITFNGPADDLAGSAADDWAVLGERMRFITALFRSRQQVASLFDAP